MAIAAMLMVLAATAQVEKAPSLLDKNRENKIVCPTCGRTFTSVEQLKKHRHTNVDKPTGKDKEQAEKPKKDEQSKPKKEEQSKPTPKKPADKPKAIKPSEEQKVAIEQILAEMVECQGGNFYMGGTAEQRDDAADDETLQHVTISTFHIGRYEVTQAQWRTIMGSNPCLVKNDSLPVDNVSWDDCQEFIDKLNAMSGRTFRLPTEAEWEYAARGGAQMTGMPYSGSENYLAVAWCKDNSDGDAHNVGTLEPNELGIYDMSGNVWEWCADWYGKYVTDKEVTDPQGADKGNTRVLRGGAYYTDRLSVRVSSRSSDEPKHRQYGTGLRLAITELDASAK